MSKGTDHPDMATTAAISVMSARIAELERENAELRTRVEELETSVAWYSARHDEDDKMMREYDRLKTIEAMAMACDGIDMGRHYEVPTEAWEALTAAVWDDVAAD